MLGPSSLVAAGDARGPFGSPPSKTSLKPLPAPEDFVVSSDEINLRFAASNDPRGGRHSAGDRWIQERA